MSADARSCRIILDVRPGSPVHDPGKFQMGLFAKIFGSKQSAHHGDAGDVVPAAPAKRGGPSSNRSSPSSTRARPRRARRAGRRAPARSPKIGRASVEGTCASSTTRGTPGTTSPSAIDRALRPSRTPASGRTESGASCRCGSPSTTRPKAASLARGLSRKDRLPRQPGRGPGAREISFPNRHDPRGACRCRARRCGGASRSRDRAAAGSLRKGGRDHSSSSASPVASSTRSRAGRQRRS